MSSKVKSVTFFMAYPQTLELKITGHLIFGGELLETKSFASPNWLVVSFLFVRFQQFISWKLPISQFELTKHSEWKVKQTEEPRKRGLLSLKSPFEDFLFLCFTVEQSWKGADDVRPDSSCPSEVVLMVSEIRKLHSGLQPCCSLHFFTAMLFLDPLDAVKARLSEKTTKPHELFQVICRETTA